MPDKLQRFAELNDYDMDEARERVESIRDQTNYPALREWADEALGDA